MLTGNADPADVICECDCWYFFEGSYSRQHVIWRFQQASYHLLRVPYPQVFLNVQCIGCHVILFCSSSAQSPSVASGIFQSPGMQNLMQQMSSNPQLMQNMMQSPYTQQMMNQMVQNPELMGNVSANPKQPVLYLNLCSLGRLFVPDWRDCVSGFSLVF